MHRGGSGFEFQPRTSHATIFCAIQMCALIVYASYFGAIVIASQSNATWLSTWMAVWMPLVEFLRNLIPAFDYSESDLLAAGFAKRITIIHHVMAMGWLFFVISFTGSMISIWKMGSADHDWVIQNLLNDRAAVALPPLMFFIALYWIVFQLGRVSAVTPFPAHKADVGLFWLAAPFIAGLFTGSLTVLAVKLALSRKRLPER